MQEIPSTAGRVRAIGSRAMAPSGRMGAATSWVIGSMLALLAALIVPHVVPGQSVARLLGIFLALVALLISSRGLQRDARGEAIVYGLALAVLFVAVTLALGWPMAWAGPAFLILAAACSAVALRNRPIMGELPAASDRTHAAIIVVGTMWAAVLAILLALG